MVFGVWVFLIVCLQIQLFAVAFIEIILNTFDFQFLWRCHLSCTRSCQKAKGKVKNVNQTVQYSVQSHTVLSRDLISKNVKVLQVCRNFNTVIFQVISYSVWQNCNIIFLPYCAASNYARVIIRHIVFFKWSFDSHNIHSRENLHVFTSVAQEMKYKRPKYL